MRIKSSLITDFARNSDFKILLYGKLLKRYQIRNGVTYVQMDTEGDFTEIAHVLDLENLGIRIPPRRNSKILYFIFNPKYYLLSRFSIFLLLLILIARLMY